jgi:proline iminopeptidase
MDRVDEEIHSFGLSDAIQESLRGVFTRFPSIDRVMIYGSRATGRYRPQSDIDLAVIAPAMSDREFSLLWMALDDLPILFRLDVSLWHHVSNPALQQAMLRDGVRFYQNREPIIQPPKMLSGL